MAAKDRFTDYLAEIPNFLSIFIFSFFFNIASPILLEISKSTGIEKTNLSFIFTFFTIGAILGQMTSVFYNRRFRKIQIILTGFIIMIPLTVMLNFNSSLVVFYAVYLISGYILGVIWIQANKFILESHIKNKERLITVFLTFYPVGAFIAPFVSSSIIRSNHTWRLIYYVIIFLLLANIILYILITGRKKENNSVIEEAKLPFGEIFFDRANNKIFFIVCAAIIFYTSSETIVATWAPTFFILARNLEVASSSITLNLFWLFIIAGRIIAAFIAGRIKSTKIMTILSILAIISMPAAIFVYNKYLIFVFISIAGLGYSMLFPLLISTGSIIYEKGRGVLATILFISGNLGVTLAPVITKFSSKVSLVISISFSFILMIFITIMILIIDSLSDKKNNEILDHSGNKKLI
ncbi:MAG: MFS transporter [Candidatus Humimicrobiaceae bacterium]